MVYCLAMPAFSLYLHIPFCRHRCGYCDFNTYAGQEGLIPAYVSALCREMEILAKGSADSISIHTIYLGGGTPSLLKPHQLEAILNTARKAFNIRTAAEITLEANPGTLALPYLQDVRRMGINRISLGMQSARPEELRLLERQHDFGDVLRGIQWARQAGFENISLDLIFGLPEQSLESWQRSLELAIGLNPDHFSLYALTLEHGTPLGRWAQRGLLLLPDPDRAADMYEWAGERLLESGYLQYEISNWARRDPQGELMSCRHNLQYWRNLPYFGLGAGAHGYVAGMRTVDVLSPAAYIQRLSPLRQLEEGAPPSFPLTSATMQAEPVDRRAEIAETMMMGLRLVREGVSRMGFQERFGQALEEVFGEQIEEVIALDLLEWGGSDGDRLRLTQRGRLLGNQVFVRFI